MLFTQLNKMRMIYGALAAAMTLTSGTATSGDLNIADEPLYLGGAVAPNIMFILDDSGSMHWEHMPSNDSDNYYMYPPNSRGVYRGSGTDTGDYNDRSPQFDAPGGGAAEFLWSVRARSSHINKLYYDPNRRYSPWPGTDRDGNTLTDMDPTCALHNAYEPDADNDGNDREAPGADGHSHDCRNLTIVNSENAEWVTANNTRNTNTRTFYPAVYYRFRNGAGDDENDINDYEKVEISSTADAYTGTNLDLYPPTGDKHPDRTDCVANATKCTYQEEMQNFANWYSYYRSRVLIARAGVGRAFDVQSTKMRVGFGSINDTAGTDTIIRGVRKFEGTERSDWFDLLYGHRMPRSGTPLRTALRDVGEYYKSTSDSGPWSETPGTTNTNPHLTCRQSYSVLMTDGFWNGGTPSVGNSDDTNGSVINNDASSTPPTFQYTPGAPYEDAWSNTLADVAMEYWKTDLRPNLNNEVPPNNEDEAFWQHMVTYTVGLGVEGDLDPVATQAHLVAGTDPGWPEPASDRTANIDDMWHAAVNSRGAFFSASDPDTFAASLAAILRNLTSRTSSASSVALNSSSFVTDSTVYQARFDTGNWTGQLLAQSVSKDANGDLQFSVDWDAANGIPSYGFRKIVTFDGTDGQPFQWGDLTTDQQTLLGSAAVVNYLRGDSSNEGTVYRNRVTPLGDIINSAPFYVGAPSAGYRDYWGAGQPESDPNTKYSDFRSTNFNRTPMIYVGANDGMLHAFNATTDSADAQQGKEQAAYVPNSIMRNLPNLANSNYQHEYFVDGSPVVRDAYFGSAWHTVLVSGLNAGGQGIFALDVTTPPSISDAESTLASKVLWEFGDSSTGFSDGDPDLGYTFGRPEIVRMHNGVWAAVFGNGYNNTADDDADGGTTNDSTTGDAALFIVNLQTGQLIQKITTETGMAEDPTGANRPNGLGEVTTVDINGDFITDYAYAGDLFGNVWKFDLTNSTSSNWDVAYEDGSGNPKPLFTARSDQTDAATAQPITSRIAVARHPKDFGGFMLYFGTGKYLEVGDNERSGQENQSLYGIWDRGEDSSGTFHAFDRDDLLQQQIIGEVTTAAGSFRILSDNTMTYHAQVNLDALYQPNTAPDSSTSTPTSLSISTHLGWYIDLLNTQGGNTNNQGEKIVSDPIVRISNLLVTTLIPSKDACDFGGESWTIEPDLATGGRVDESRFDVDSDGTYSMADYVTLDGSGNYVSVSDIIDADGDGNIDPLYDADGDGILDSSWDADGDGVLDGSVVVSGKKIETGIASAPKLLRDADDDTTSEIYNTSSGILEVFKKNEELFEGRQSWIELFR